MEGAETSLASYAVWTKSALVSPNPPTDPI